jgi:ankyrin repeat protein
MMQIPSSLRSIFLLACSIAIGRVDGKAEEGPPPFFLQDPSDSLCLAGETFQRCSVETLWYVVGSPGSYQIHKRPVDPDSTEASSDGLCLSKKTCNDITQIEGLKVTPCSHCGAKDWNILGDADTGYVLTTSVGAPDNAAAAAATCVVRQGTQVRTAPCDSVDVPYTPLQLRFAAPADIATMSSPAARFIAAAADGNLAYVKESVAANATLVQARDWDELTALIPAASAGHLEICQFLLEQGADVHAADKDGITALMEASIMGHEAIVKLLLEKDATVDAAANSEVTALWLAASEGQAAIVKLLLEKGAAATNTRSDGITALMTAAMGGHTAVVQLLLEHGADVTAADPEGSTPLMNAAENGTVAVLELLTAAASNDPAYVNTMSKAGFNALIIAAAHGHVEAVRHLLKSGANAEAAADTSVTALMFAAASNRVEVMKVLVEEGKANLETKHNNGGTALLEAATGGAVDSLRYLMEQGANVDFVDDDGVTPLMAVASLGNVEGLELILDALKSKLSPEALTQYINRFSKSGGSTIMFATAGGHLNITKQLYALGADAHAIARATPDYLEKLAAMLEAGTAPEDEPHVDGLTALHVAAQGGHLDVVQFLIDEAKVDVSVVDDAGRTPLSLAIKGSYNEVAKALVKAGADPNRPYVDEEGVSHNLLFDAIMVENVEFAELLIEHGATLYHVDEKHVSTLLQASHRGLSTVVAALLRQYAADVAAGKAKENYLNEASSEGITPLIAAASEGHVEVVKSLIAAGVNVEVKDADQTTALMAASARGHRAIVQELLTAGALVNEQNADGHTALMFAYNGKNQVDTLWERYSQYVKENGEDVSDVDDNGTSQIIREALDNHVALIELLIKVGKADLHLKDKEGHTAKDFDYHPDADSEIMDKAKKTAKILDESKNEL